MRIITGGQTGVDQAAWRAARAAGLPTGGMMPRGFLTEDGPRPDFAAFGAAESNSTDVDDRTLANVLDADATLVLTSGRAASPGTRHTIHCCAQTGKPLLVIDLDDCSLQDACMRIARWLENISLAVLHVAGPRESESRGIGVQAETLLSEVFARQAPE